MADIGTTLREARIRARIDISEVEARTKIRAKYLRAIENEEWDLLPGPVYVKSFLRTYGDFLGRRQPAARRRVQAPLRAPGRPGSASDRARSRERERERRRRRRPRLGPVGAVVLVLAAVVVALYFIGGGLGGSGNTSSTRRHRRLGVIVLVVIVDQQHHDRAPPAGSPQAPSRLRPSRRR